MSRSHAFRPQPLPNPPPCLPSTPPTVHNIPATLPALAITFEALLGHISCFWSMLGRAHTRLTYHMCTQLPSYQKVALLCATHHHAKHTPSGGRHARQLASTCPSRKCAPCPALSFITLAAVPNSSIRYRHAGFPCRQTMSRRRLQHAPKPPHQSSPSRCIAAQHTSPASPVSLHTCNRR